VAKKHILFHFWGKEDEDVERYEEDASFKMSIEDIIEGIKLRTIKRLTDKDYLQVEDFLEKDENGKTLLELVYDYNIQLDDKMTTRLVNNPDIIRECLKHKYSILVNKPNKYVLLNSSVSSNTLFMPINGNETLIEILIKKDLVSMYIIKSINDIRVFDICKKYNRYDLIQFLSDNLLLSKYGNNDTLFEYLISKNQVNENMIANMAYSYKVINICKKYNKLYLFKHSNINYLFYTFKDGSSIMDHLIKANQADRETFRIIGNHNQNIVLNSIVSNKAYRYLVYYPNVLFLETHNGYYLDYVLDNYNKSMDLYLTHIPVDSLPLRSQAILYLKCAEHGLIKFLPKLSEDKLLTKEGDKTLLTEMLKIDKRKTVEKVLTNSMLSNSNIALALSFFGINVRGTDVPVPQKERGTKNKKKYLEIEIPKHIENKIYNLSRLFLIDGKSDKDAVDVLVASYKNLAKNGYVYLEREIDLLTEYKKRNPNFLIRRTDKKPYFAFNDRIIFLNDSSMDAFNHELGHALHFIGANRCIPRNFKYEITKIQSDPKGLTRVDQYSQMYYKIEEVASKEAERIYEREYGHYFDNNAISKINHLIELDKKEKLKRYGNYGIDSRILEKAINNLYKCSVSEYIENFKRVKIEEIKTSLLYEKYTSMSALGDILDAIYQGRLKGELCKNSKGETIYISFGHGLNYYNEEQSMFDEIMADYSQIIKEKDGKEAIEFLRYVVGDDFVDMISKYYEKEVLNFVPEKMPIEGEMNYGR